MQNHHSFRLFISSTFSDFSAEREVLQTKVFPELREYCRQKGGFGFQPIDLRWGVTQEAQLDQRTLDLCLNEVRACKSHPAPNFLILAGDRYGWIPLPHAIEQPELETLLPLISEEDRALVLSWYELDDNQLPSSYMLKSRSGKYVDYEAWNEVETALRGALTSAVEQSDLSESQRKKYFLSATEAEVFEGILEYGNEYSEYQKELIKKGLLDPQYDRENVFAFIRGITGETTDSIYADKNPELASRFKDAIRNQVSEVLDVETVMQPDGIPDGGYLIEFEKRVTEFLKTRVDGYSKHIEQRSELEQEILQHRDYAEQKLTHFQGRESSRAVIASYIDGKSSTNLPHPDRPLILYGPSGRGKSALMAKAAEEAQSRTNVKVIQRYIGATPTSSSTVSILLSILEELGIETDDIAPKKSDKAKLSGEDQFDFEEFSEEVSYRLAELEDDGDKKVVFIDAVDQLENGDRFLWLPATLPAHLKIIISALEDKNYPEASTYYESLKNRPLNFYEVPEMEEPLTLLRAILASYHRRLQSHQEEYFLRQYKNSPSPLFISMAAQEMRYWKSNDAVDAEDISGGDTAHTQDLADSQQGLIAEFISNLSSFYHHDPDFIRIVMGFIHASKDGLSEAELLQLISADPELVQTFAPETWHKNPTGELPTVIWARLYAQINPFLKRSLVDGDDVMSFFHREFVTVIANQYGQQETHRKAIEACQKMVLKHQHEDFNSTRWGKLYVTLVTEYGLKHGISDSQLQNFIQPISSINNISLLEALQIFIDVETQFYALEHQSLSVIFATLNNCILKQLFLESPQQWKKAYQQNIEDYLFFTHRSKNTDYLDYYIKLLNSNLLTNKDYSLAIIQITRDFKKILRGFKLTQLSPFIQDLAILSIKLMKNGKYNLAIEIQKKIVIFWRKKFFHNKHDAINYSIALNNLGVTYREQRKYSKSLIITYKALKVATKELDNENYFIGGILNSLGWTLYLKGNVTEAKGNLEKAVNILNDHISTDDDLLIECKKRLLHVNNRIMKNA